MDSTDEIRNLLATYCERIDRGDFAGVGELFREGGLADEHGNVFATGAEAVADVFGRQVILYEDGTPSTKHLVVNTVFESLSDDEAVVRSSYVVFQAAGDAPLRPIITGRYRDTFGRDTEARWCFAERRFFVDLAGDLSLHLRPEFIP
ncbi:MAG TPA: nuclear transport factor 2 family protein [Acidimicrobiales bacterium]|nr:nuclear transport factor 2 family protein [Acidimicrobiales bacterium]